MAFRPQVRIAGPEGTSGRNSVAARRLEGTPTSGRHARERAPRNVALIPAGNRDSPPARRRGAVYAETGSAAGDSGQRRSTWISSTRALAYRPQRRFAGGRIGLSPPASSSAALTSVAVSDLFSGNTRRRRDATPRPARDLRLRPESLKLKVFCCGYRPSKVVVRLQSVPGVGAAAEHLVESDRHGRRNSRAPTGRTGQRSPTGRGVTGSFSSSLGLFWVSRKVSDSQPDRRPRRCHLRQSGK